MAVSNVAPTKSESAMPCRAGALFIVVVAVLGVMSILGACGRRGPLYLPEDPPAQTATKAPDAEAPATAGPEVPSPPPPVRP